MIQFFVEDISFDLQPLKLIPDWISWVAQEHAKVIAHIDYVFCSDEYLLQINQQYLAHDYYTDIITFDNRDNSNQPIESDIFISVERVQENAHQINVEFFHELLRVIVHGLLHLLGFDDHTQSSKEQMRYLEDEHVSSYFQQFHI